MSAAMTTAPASYPPPKVVEKRLEDAEQLYEAWRCLMAVMVGSCLALALFCIAKSIWLLHPFVLGVTRVLLLFGVVWGVSQIRPSIVILGTAAIALSLIIFFAVIPLSVSTSALDVVIYFV